MLIPKNMKLRKQGKVARYFDRTKPLYGDDWADLRQQTIARQKYRCFYCHGALKSAAYPDGAAWECHHRKSLGQNGTNASTNRVAACMKCHDSQHKHRG